MIIVIGEILFDLFPDGRRIGGAPFNFAFHLKKLGFNVRFISRVGKDEMGLEVLDIIKANQFDLNDIQRDPVSPTGTVRVLMGKGRSHDFSIANNVAYDHIAFDSRMENLSESGPKLFYFGTLIQRTAKGHALVKSVIARLPPGTQTFCDINLRPGSYSPKVVAFSIEASDILKLSHEELNILVPDKGLGLERRSTLLLEKGPKLVILTLGEKGSLWVSKKGVVHSFLDKSCGLLIADTVGAGDAYAAMAAAARLSGLENPKAMALAQEFAGQICQIQGALPLDSQFYERYLPRFSHE